MSTCAGCGASNPDGQRFCGECGTAVEQTITCPTCATTWPPTQRFCGDCGTPLTGDTPAPTAPQHAAPELRLVSVLFCDLVGYTTLSEGLDSDEVRELLSGYFDVARTIVERFGGRVEKFIGDAVMAVWGAGRAAEDDAERAVRAGLELVDAVAAYGEQARAQLAARVGVVTGRAAAVDDPNEGIVVGDRVNTAARIQSAADTGTVYVDEATRSAAQAAIAFTDVGMHELKGKAEPLRLWRADRAIGGTAGSYRVDGLEARFVGRDAELRLLKKLFHGCVDRRAAWLVSVVGAPGSGKTRLRWEFERYTDGLADTVYWHFGRCLSYGNGVAYWALAEMVRQRFGIAEQDAVPVATGKLREGLATWIADDAERAYLEPRLAPLLGIADSDMPREELFAGWRLFFERLADQAPVVLSVEDLHWGDPGLFDFLDSLLDWSARYPIFVVSFARPEVSERRPEWATGRRNATTLSLDPLSDAAMTVLLGDLVGDLPADVRARIVARSEGIPLYAVETIRSLIDRDLVVPQDGEYRVAGEIGDLDTPATLTALLAARLDSLSPSERALVKDLAVLGTTFPRGAISAVSELTEDVIDQHVAALLRKEILGIRSDPLSPDRGQIQFTQNLLRTVAYESLSRRERKARHLAVATHLRATFDDDGSELAEVIAAHYDDALNCQPDAPDADDIRELAAEMYTRAGRRAATLGSYASAFPAFMRATELTQDRTRRAALLLEAAEAASVLIDVDGALTAGDEAAQLFTELGDASNLRRAIACEGEVLAKAPRVEEAINVMKPHVDAIPADAKDAGAAVLLTMYGNTLTGAGRLAEAGQYVERGFVLAQGLDDIELQGRAANAMGNVRSFEDRHVEAAAFYRAAYELLMRAGLTTRALASLGNFADLETQSDRPDIATTAETVTQANRLGQSTFGAFGSDNWVSALMTLGRWDEAEEVWRTQRELNALYASVWGDTNKAILDVYRGDTSTLEDTLSRHADMDDAQVLANDAALTASGLLAQGRCAELADRAIGLVESCVNNFGLRYGPSRLVWPECVDGALRAGRLDVAADLVRLITDRPVGHVPPFLRAQVSRAQSLLAAANGETVGVEEGLRESIEVLTELGYPYWLARAQVDLGYWLRRNGEVAEADALDSAAAATYESLGVVRPLPAVLARDPADALSPIGGN